MKHLFQFLLTICSVSILSAQMPSGFQTYTERLLARYDASQISPGQYPDLQSRQNTYAMRRVSADTREEGAQFWDNVVKTEFEFQTSPELKQTYQTYVWLSNIDNWEKASVTTHWFRPDGLLDTTVAANFNETNNTLEDYYGEKRFYNANGALTLQNQYILDPTTGNLELSRQISFTYNAANQLTLKEEDNNGQLRKVEYVYDGALLTEETAFFFNQITFAWEPISQTRYFYNAAGLLSARESYTRSDPPTDWKGLSRLEYEYDQENRLLKTIAYDEDGSGGWLPSVKSDLTYASFDALEKETISLWNGINDWVTANISLYKYEESIPFAQLLIPYTYKQEADEGLFNFRLDTVVTTSFDAGIGLGEGRYVFDWTEGVSNTQHLPDTDFAIFPNPTSDLIHFQTERDLSGATFQLFDVHGRLQLQKEINGNQPVSAAGLPDGVYFYQLGKNGDWWVKGKAVISQQGR